jgi:hypothetical protein
LGVLKRYRVTMRKIPTTLPVVLPIRVIKTLLGNAKFPIPNP